MAIILTSRINKKNICVFNCNEVRLIELMPPKLLESFKKNNYLLLHFNAYQHHLPLEDFFDGYLAARGILNPNIDQTNSKIINLSTRNFLPQFPSLENLDSKAKFWDICIVANAVRNKNIDRLLSVLSACNQKGKILKALIIAPRPGKMHNKVKWYSDLYTDFAPSKVFPNTVDIISVIRPSSQDLYPLSREAIFSFMKMSRFLFAPSDSEGECRVIHEALSVGTPVICFSHLEGAGQDYLNDQNSIKLSWPSIDATLLIDRLENYPKIQLPKYPEFNALSSKSMMIDSLNNLFCETFSTHDFNDHDYSMALAGHLMDSKYSTISKASAMYTYLLRENRMVTRNLISLLIFKQYDLHSSLKSFYRQTLSSSYRSFKKLLRL